MRAAAEIEPVSRMLSRRLALPGPMRAPDSKTMLILTFAMRSLRHALDFNPQTFCQPAVWRARDHAGAQPLRMHRSSANVHFLSRHGHPGVAVIKGSFGSA